MSLLNNWGRRDRTGRMAGFVFCTLLVSLPHAAQSADPEFTLQQKDVVTVNPATKRATMTRDGVTVPLWDGTHRMQNGSVLIIKNGVVVPNKSMVEPPGPPPTEAQEWMGVQIAGYSPCEKLVQRVCGAQDLCGDTEGCDLARQLRAMEDEERDASEDRYRMTYTSGQCQNAMEDRKNFPLCGRAVAPTSGQAGDED